MPGVVLGLCLVVRAGPLAAQAWDSPAADALVDRAVARRAQVDSSLKAWTGDGAGTLQFLVELGNSTILPPRVVKLVELASQGKLRPRISHRFPLEQAADAIQAVIDRKVIGKAVLVG